MSGSIQSSNYVPGVSGWKIDSTGEFEINPTRPSSSAEPQTITVTAGEWSEYDLPANAIERYAFIGAEVAKIPAEYRDNAQFATKDFSFDCDGSDVRTTLSYDRQETHEEIVARLEKAKMTGTRIVRAGGCTTTIIDGVVRWRIGDLTKPAQLEPFKVVDGATYLNEAFVKDGTIASPWQDDWSVKVKLNSLGQPVFAGFGVGINSQFVINADRFAVNGRDASEILRDIAASIDETALGQALREKVDRIDGSVTEKVKEVIRAELQPGGLLHRSR
ncbi:DUF1983 domain-containing protein [Pseudomonas lactucae]|uniref:DUF1983 domain-containing protein n=1 Tax=Pseudomonas lactucae TaxID=2813360 RepID=UPI002FCCE8B4